MKINTKVKIPNIKYTTNVSDQVEKSAKKALNNIKKYKPGLQHDYLNKMKLEKEKKGNGRYIYAITNSKKSMTWFLEKGHIIWNNTSTRVKPTPHLKPTVRQLKMDLNAIIVDVKKGEK